jgi:hypothetical protein
MLIALRWERTSSMGAVAQDRFAAAVKSRTNPLTDAAHDIKTPEAASNALLFLKEPGVLCDST